MKIPLKTKIAFWWWKKFRFKEPANSVQKISKKGTGVRSLFVILPQDRTHLSIAQHFLKTLASRGQFSAINKIISWEEHREFMDPELLLRSQLIGENDINKYGLLTLDSLKLLTSGQFNGILNLDPELNPISTQIVSSFNSEIRIGFSSNYIKDIYNINIENGKGTNYVERGYKYILEVLGL